MDLDQCSPRDRVSRIQRSVAGATSMIGRLRRALWPDRQATVLLEEANREVCLLLNEWYDWKRNYHRLHVRFTNLRDKAEGNHSVRRTQADDLRTQLARLSERFAAHRERAEGTERALRMEISLLRQQIDRGLREPGPTTACEKIRLASEADAHAFARALEQTQGQAEGEIEPYQCGECPRRPIPGTPRYWHVRHADMAQRGQHGAQYNHGRPDTRIERRLDPASVAALRAKFNSDTSSNRPRRDSSGS